MGQHDGLAIPLSPKESCPGGNAEKEQVGVATGQGGMVDVPPGVPKVGSSTNYFPKQNKTWIFFNWLK